MTVPRIAVAILAAVSTALAFPAIGGSTSSFAVSTSLSGCSKGGGEVKCRLEVAFDPVPAATAYTAIAKRPDGSSEDLGGLSPGSTPVSVSYRGDGTYVVTVTAWGEGAATSATGASG